jgi:4-hydroxy 2-oxovalerate aldolase
VWQLIQEHIAPLQRTMEWGALPAYVIGGQHNQHPRAAIAWRASAERDNCADFYDRVMADV